MIVLIICAFHSPKNYIRQIFPRRVFETLTSRILSGAVEWYRPQCRNRTLSLNVSIVGRVPSALGTTSWYVEVNVAFKCDARHLLAM